MIKYVVDTSVDALKFNLAHGDLELHDYRYQAEEQRESWEKVFKITIEEA